MQGRKSRPSLSPAFFFLIVLFLTALLSLLLLSPQLPSLESNENTRRSLSAFFLSQLSTSDTENWRWRTFHKDPQAWYQCFEKNSGVSADELLKEQKANMFWKRDKRPPVVMIKEEATKEFLPFLLQKERECEFSCHFILESSSDKYTPECMEEIDAFIFHSSSLPSSQFLHQKTHFQSSILFSSRQLATTNTKKEFDFIMSDQLDSDVPFSPSISILKQHNWADNYFKVTQQVDVLLLTSSKECVESDTTLFIREFSQLMKMDSLSPCFDRNGNNRELIVNQPGAEGRIKYISKYKFAIVLDSEDEEVASGLFFEALIAGAVPIYKGTKNIDTFAPSSHSFLKLDSYRKPADLVKLLEILLQDNKKYKEYLQWKKYGFSRSFLDLMTETAVDSAACRLCAKVVKRFNNLAIMKENDASKMNVML